MLDARHARGCVRDLKMWGAGGRGEQGSWVPPEHWSCYKHSHGFQHEHVFHCFWINTWVEHIKYSLFHEELPNYFSKEFIPFSVTTIDVWEFELLHIFATTSFFLVPLTGVVLICVSLMDNDVEHLFRCSSAICTSSLVRCCPHLLPTYPSACLFHYCWVSRTCMLSIPDPRPLSALWFARIFSQSASCLSFSL